jgi:putative copper export protein
LSAVVHVAHVVLAGIWLGGVIFTTAVVSPAFKAMKWSEPERVLVRGSTLSSSALAEG